MLSVVIPCLNESLSIARYEGELLPALDALALAYEVLVVDDGSTDETGAALKALAARRPQVKPLSHGRNQGMGAALATGFAAASGDWIATLDADLTFHPEQLKTLLARQKETGADLVAGSPFLSAGGMAGVSWPRRLPSVIINAFYRGLADPRLTAYTPIFRLYRAAALKNIPLTSSGFEINAEIAARFALAGLSLAEAPAILTTRTEGASKLSRWRELRRHLRLIFRLYVQDLLK